MSGTPYTLDDYGFWGPNYSFADNLPLPGQIGVRQESSFGAIFDAVGGVNFYVDAIAFGSPTFFDENPTDPTGKPYQHPLGLRYFLNTGMRCSNGATMAQYFDGVTRGDLLGTHIEQALASANLPGLKGMAPGLLENAFDALDPRPIIAAVTSTGYPVCEPVMCPVGDSNGEIQNENNATQPYILGNTYANQNGVASQVRWVQAYDSTGSPINITKDEFAAQPKCYNADGSYITTNPPAGCPAVEPTYSGGPASSNYPLCTQPMSTPSSQMESFANMGSDYSIMMGGIIILFVMGIFITWAGGWSSIAQGIAGLFALTHIRNKFSPVVISIVIIIATLIALYFTAPQAFVYFVLGLIGIILIGLGSFAMVGGL
jgi:hypothetical protein